jgi:hypothetical protein
MCLLDAQERLLRLYAAPAWQEPTLPAEGPLLPPPVPPALLDLTGAQRMLLLLAVNA